MVAEKPKRRADRVPIILFACSVVILPFLYGVAVGRYKFFPYHLLLEAKTGYTELKTQLLRVQDLGDLPPGQLPSYYIRPKQHFQRVIDTPAAYKGLNLVIRFKDKLEYTIDIMDMDGHVIHTWDVDWWKVWPDAKHVPEDLLPRSKPGGFIHDAVVLKGGDLVFIYGYKGLVRMRPDGSVVWRLPYLAHHSVYVANDGNLWVCGFRRHTNRDADYPFRNTPFDEYTLLEVSPAGKVIHEWSVPDILRRNGRDGLLNLDWTPPGLTGYPPHDDRLHLNDVQPFSDTLKEGFFKHGDILVSLCNVNTVFAFNRYTEKITYISTGQFMLQHDPDFLSGNTFSVLDNRTHTGSSRIAIVDARDDSVRTYYEGTPEHPFYTAYMGKEQWLPNGDLLITETYKGRAFEIDRTGKVVWQWVNYVDKGVVGMVSTVMRLPADYARYYQQPAPGAVIPRATSAEPPNPAVRNDYSKPRRCGRHAATDRSAYGSTARRRSPRTCLTSGQICRISA